MVVDWRGKMPKFEFMKLEFQNNGEWFLPWIWRNFRLLDVDKRQVWVGLVCEQTQRVSLKDFDLNKSLLMMFDWGLRFKVSRALPKATWMFVKDPSRTDLILDWLICSSHTWEEFVLGSLLTASSCPAKIRPLGDTIVENDRKQDRSGMMIERSWWKRKGW